MGLLKPDGWKLMAGSMTSVTPSACWS